MKTASRLALFAPLVWLAISATADGQDTGKDPGRKLVVNGSATVYARPDAARVSFVVNTEVIAKAREENDKQTKKMKDSLVALGFQGLDIQVQPGAINNVTNMDPQAAPGVPALKHQQTQCTFSVTIRHTDVDKLREMVTRVADVAMENGGTAASNNPYGQMFRMGGMGGGRMGGPETNFGPNIEWLAENPGEARRDAIKRAVSDAQANAQAAVGDAKLTLVGVTISTGAKDDRVNALLRNPFMETPTPSAGRLPITVDVQVTFSY